ncbi:MAG: glycoside hydrolase N-terminal domain-containing protein, partial [Eubacterium sp.]|nr:glycoside hydrolase N-terminal domain-containing protein [Eubacterium sp.]
MNKTIKKLLSGLIGFSVLNGSFAMSPGIGVSAEPKTFDPETVMWTDTMIEEAVENYHAEYDKNINGSNSGSYKASPYGRPGDSLTPWAYAEHLWTYSYPVGNGRMGGMIAGGIEREIIQINEDTIWAGSPYATGLKNEKGELITNHTTGVTEAETLEAVGQTSGSKPGAWRYYRGANSDGSPAPIGSPGVIIGDETFREKYPQFADKSISWQSLNIDNAQETEALQNRYSMERMVENTILGSPSRQKAFKSFVEVYLDFNQTTDKVSNYTKSLDMKTGIVNVDYDYDGKHFTRENFASYPDQAVVTHIESDADFDFSAQLHTFQGRDGSGASAASPWYKFEKVSDNEIKITARVSNGGQSNLNTPAGVNIIQFEARMIVDAPGAVINVVNSGVGFDTNDVITVKGGKVATVYVVGASNFVNYLKVDNTKPGRDSNTYSANVKSRSYSEIKERHIADYSEQFNRTSLTIDNDKSFDSSNIATELRIRSKAGDFKKGGGNSLSDADSYNVHTTYEDGDNKLATLDFNYGKYLLISGSRIGREASGGNVAIPMSQPLTLAGKWNHGLSASWDGKYTININTEMNYWAAQPLNLGENEMPLIDAFKALAQGGSITAANQYSILNERGDNTYQPGDPWVMHHNFDLWRGTMPIDNATAGLWPTGGVWLLDHAWQAYRYSGDKTFLEEYYPIMKGSAAFFTQFLVIDPKTGYLVTAASCSPEQGGVQPGPAMDTQLIRNLYYSVLAAAKDLGRESTDKVLLDKIRAQLPSDFETNYFSAEDGKLAPTLIDASTNNGADGRVEEWVRGDVTMDLSITDTGTWTVNNPFANNATVGINKHDATNAGGHRHVSQLYELFPGKHIDPYSEDPNEQLIYRAFKDSVAARGAGTGQGWGVAWRMNLSARSKDGNTASERFEQLMRTRTSPNLFDQHPNFQIDGNYGITSGVIEMLLQSRDNTIDILPALPTAWGGGEFKGFKTIGGSTVDVKWTAGKATEVKIVAGKTGELKIANSDIGNATISNGSGTVASVLNAAGNIRTFNATAGTTYTISGFEATVPTTPSSTAISLYPAGNKTFMPAPLHKISSSLPYGVRVNNAGTEATGALTVELSGAGSDGFTLSTDTIPRINAASSARFTVTPKSGLEKGVYNATVTVVGDSVVQKTFDVSFTVGDPEKYTLTFDGNKSDGGTPPTDPLSPYDDQTEAVLPDNTGNLTRGEFVFVGWNTEADGSGDKYKSGDKIKMTKDTVLYAYWMPPGGFFYDVIYDGNGATGAGPVDAVRHPAEEEATVMDNTGFEKSGYAFRGWNTEPDGSGIAYNAGDKIIMLENVTLFAMWERAMVSNATNVLLDNPSQNVSAPMLPTVYSIPVENGGRQTRIEARLKTGADGNRYAGMSLKYSDGTFYFITKRFDITGSNNGVKIHAGRGGNTGTGTTVVDYATAASTQAINNARGPLYTGWSQDNWGEGLISFTITNDMASLSWGENFTMEKPTTTENLAPPAAEAKLVSVDIYKGQAQAIFEVQSLRVTNLDPNPSTAPFKMVYDANLGMGKAPSNGVISYAPGVSVTVLNKGAFERPGYDFVEWNTKADGSGTNYKPGDTFIISADTTLYAVWEEGEIIPVSDIIGVPTTMNAGKTLALTGTVTSAGATVRNIVWSVKEAGNTGAVIDGSILSANAVGTVVVTATIVSGISIGTDFKKDFTIVVEPAIIEPTILVDISNFGEWNHGNGDVNSVNGIDFAIYDLNTNGSEDRVTTEATLNFAGGHSTSSGNKGAVKFTINENFRITATVNSNASERFLVLFVDDPDNPGNQALYGGIRESATITTTQLLTGTLDGLPAGTYYLGSAGSGINVNKLIIEGLGGPAPSKTLNSIAITTAPGKTVYTAGESFDQTGMVVTATYSD